MVTQEKFEQAHDEIVNRLYELGLTKNQRILVIRDLILYQFVWDKTPQGWDYWNDVIENLAKVANG